MLLLIVGWDEENDPTWSLEKALADNKRIEYFDLHLQKLHLAIKYVPIKRYFSLD